MSLEDSPVVAEVPPSHCPVVRGEAIDDDLCCSWWLCDRRCWWSWCSRPCKGGRAAPYHRCALQVGTAHAPAVVKNTHVSGLAIVATSTALRADRNAFVLATGQSGATGAVWTAGLAGLQTVAVRTASVRARTTPPESCYNGQHGSVRAKNLNVLTRTVAIPSLTLLTFE